MATDITLRSKIELGVVPTHIKFIGGLVPDQSGKFPREADGKLAVVAEMERLIALSRVKISSTQIPRFPGADADDVNEMITGLKDLGLMVHLIMMVGGADPMNPADEDAVVAMLTESLNAAGFYFARKLQQELKGEVPIGLILASVGGTRIELWLAKEGLGDIPALHPLLKHRPYTDHTSSYFNGCVAPLAPYAARGVLWYQGENSELKVQSPDSYYLKMKALIPGWKRVWGQDDLAFYFVMIANYGKLQPTVEPVLISGGGWDADTRLQQVKAMALPHSGCASAMDIGVSKESWAGYHPENKQDVGERLALWALKNEYGRSSLVTSGPVLRNVAVAGNTVVCNFDHLGGGLMVGLKRHHRVCRATMQDGQGDYQGSIRCLNRRRRRRV